MCARGNYVREMPGWRVELVHDVENGVRLEGEDFLFQRREHVECAVSFRCEVEDLHMLVAPELVFAVQTLLDQGLEVLHLSHAAPEGVGGAQESDAVGARLGRERVITVTHAPAVELHHRAAMSAVGVGQKLQVRQPGVEHDVRLPPERKREIRVHGDEPRLLE